MENPSKSPAKYSYKISNWKEYNESLKKRGKISLWMNARLLKIWSEIDVSKKIFGEKNYPDVVIEFCLVMSHLYHLPLRQTTGFVEDLLENMGCIGFDVPDFSTLSRRAASLPVKISKKLEKGKKIDVIVDSTGLKLHGEGEWKVKKHGAGKHRMWLQLHMAIDASTGEIVANLLTSNSIGDAPAAKIMLADHKENMASCRGDGAYDKFGLREFLGDITQIIPPPKGAVLHEGTAKKPAPDYLSQRNAAVSRINETDRKTWKVEAGYHKRSLVETTMFRYKVTFGGHIRAKNTENQQTEVNIKCKILNKFASYGMPNSQKR